MLLMIPFSMLNLVALLRAVSEVIYKLSIGFTWCVVRSSSKLGATFVPCRTWWIWAPIQTNDVAADHQVLRQGSEK